MPQKKARDNTDIMLIDKYGDDQVRMVFTIAMFWEDIGG